MNRARWSFAAAAFSGVSLVLALVAGGVAHGNDDPFPGESSYGVEAVTLFVIAGLLALATVLLLVYGLRTARNAVAITAIVLLLATGLFGGSDVLFLPFFAAICAGLAMAGGKPLPPADPADPRLHTPFSRPSDPG